MVQTVKADEVKVGLRFHGDFDYFYMDVTVKNEQRN